MSTAQQILESVKDGKCSIEEAQEGLAKLKLGELKKVTYKVSPKGCLAFYGIRRMPISLYFDELNQILNIVNSDAFKQFVIDNKGSLSIKEKN
jgi:hypothetical protein